jgi:hypothetical protein
MELDLIEPWLFIGLLPGKVDIFADHIANFLHKKPYSQLPLTDIIVE